MKQLLKEQMEGVFESSVRDAIKNNPLKGTPMEGMMIQTTIGRTAGNFKESFKAEKHKLQLTDNEIEQLVDEVSTKIIGKYLKF